MTSTQFKTKLKDLKSFLKGKAIHISLTTKSSQTQKITFNTLKEFGNKVLELEKLGTHFAFTGVGNTLVEKTMITQKEMIKWTSQGVWNSVYINATILKN